MNAGLAPRPIVDTGFAPQPIMNWDPLIVVFTVIFYYRPSVIKANSLE
jgi:hypothetical protein